MGENKKSPRRRFFAGSKTLNNISNSSPECRVDQVLVVEIHFLCPVVELRSLRDCTPLGTRPVFLYKADSMSDKKFLLRGLIYGLNLVR